MALSTDLEILNRVLRDLSGCFLQYAADIWPWTSVGADGVKLKSVVDECVARQRQSIGLLSEYLAPPDVHGQMSAAYCKKQPDKSRSTRFRISKSVESDMNAGLKFRKTLAGWRRTAWEGRPTPFG